MHRSIPTRNDSTTTATKSCLMSSPILCIVDTSSVEDILGNGISKQGRRDARRNKHGRSLYGSDLSVVPSGFRWQDSSDTDKEYELNHLVNRDQ